MKIPSRLGALLLLLAWLTGCAGAPPAPAEAAAKSTTGPASPAVLLLVSIDGFRADYLERGLTPTLAGLAAEGVRAQWMQPAFPSLTFPNHYTLVTGLVPDHHGIVNNTMLDPVLGRFSLGDRTAVSDGRWWDGGTPIWETADDHGLRTATMFWPGSEAAIHGRHPDDWRPYDGSVTPAERVAQVLAWLDRPLAQRPRFITLYFDDVDHAGHAFGPDSPELDAALRTVDAAMARLIAGLRERGLYERLNLIVVADHGMAAVPEGQMVMVDRLIRLDEVQTVSLGVLAGFNPKPGREASFAAIEHTLEAPQPHMHCWDKTRIPARLQYGSHPRVPQLVCLADVGWTIGTEGYLASRRARHGTLSRGEHGYDNAEPAMRALFIAHGPAFRRGAVVPPFPNVDVYPLMTHLLALPPAANDGRYADVEAMLQPAAR